jgi:cytochrome c oxidase subunit III
MREETASAGLGRASTPSLATGRQGMKLLIAALSMLFGASTVGYLVIRAEAPRWPPPGVPKLPEGLWISTLLLLVSSATIAWAGAAIRRDNQRGLRVAMLVTTLLGLAFLASQTLNWFALVAESFTAHVNLYGFLFYVLTGLHAAHVVGGLIPLSTVTARAWRGRYTSSRHAGIVYCSMYWHFLDIVWLVLFTVLVLLP